MLEQSGDSILSDWVDVRVDSFETNQYPIPQERLSFGDITVEVVSKINVEDVIKIFMV